MQKEFIAPQNHRGEALKWVLAEAGAGRQDVVKHNIYFQCGGDDEAVSKFLDEIDRVRLGYFSDPGPTTTETRVGLDREGALIQIDAWAVVGEPRERLMPDGHWSWSKPLPFSHGWKVGDMIFVGGQRSLDAHGNVFQFIRKVLAEGRLDESDVAKLYIYYHGDGDWNQAAETRATIDRVQREFYPHPRPAVTAIRVSGFAFEDLLIEIEAFAICRE